MTNLSTEQKILDSARELFIKKGMSGTKMQEIADNAGINKALLHYYFRKKEFLFEKIFIEGFSKLSDIINILFENDISLEEKITSFTNKYISIFEKNKFLPMFILHEIQRNPENLYNLINKSKVDPKRSLESMVENFDISNYDIKSIFINTIALCIFPIIAEPLLKISFFNNDQKLYNQFLEKRKTDIPKIVLNSLKKTTKNKENE